MAKEENDQKAQKDQQMVFGIRAVQEAINAGKEIEKVMIKKGLQGPLFQNFLDLVREHNVPFQFVPIEKLNRVTRQNHQGVIAMISPVTYQDAEQLIPTLFEDGKEPFILVLDHITDVRNFGAIARTAECAGVDAIIIPDTGAAAVTSDAMKTSAGALHTIPVCRVRSLISTIEFLQMSGIKIVAATEKGAVDYDKANYRGPIALVMGAEDKGVNPKILAAAEIKSKIPIMGEIESLNVSVAAGILMYEIVKVRMN
ncbi:23S rRNA (guanosine(2251)-2'-O)-methyltransferase RlmB [Carboxylicivirga sp. M1479]|uniref:23S rRNA (guanosine(2251)-2'-O)-methyltransferase RlmB n=1 Tax=Carboxylicivirga sp. M1479 TaxID=2594476 RepID=UPI00117767B7|nr:23S rRNA (guanosine(2251)-2'-O)-methyltransferase RlmB [Carboxylicivirga sp. M1479]TRX66017.1 23S rRNA (guanosine(2251)-2'-O)-methyltransferase RlmB [Carboxylicivirga sp. M1479]